MPSRFGFMIGVILIAIITIVNVAVYPTITKLRHSKKADNKATAWITYIVSILFVFMIIFMIFFLNI